MVPRKAAGRRGSAQRRFVLRSGAVAAVGALASGARMVFDPKGGWAMDAEALRPPTLQTLVCAARDLHRDPHRHDADYARAVKQLDTAAKDDRALRTLLEAGVGEIDRLARQRHGKPYIALAGEAARHAILRVVAATPFLHRLKDQLIQELSPQDASAPLAVANGSWLATDRWPGAGAELGLGRSLSEESRAGV